MIGLIAIIVGFVGGVVGRAWKFEKAHQKLVAFFVPLTICTLLLYVPFLSDALRSGLGTFNSQQWREWGLMQLFCIIAAFLVTGAGWICTLCVQEVFEEKL